MKKALKILKMIFKRIENLRKDAILVRLVRALVILAIGLPMIRAIMKEPDFEIKMELLLINALVLAIAVCLLRILIREKN